MYFSVEPQVKTLAVVSLVIATAVITTISTGFLMWYFFRARCSKTKQGKLMAFDCSYNWGFED